MVKNHNNEASSSKSSKTSDDAGSSTWPHLNPYLLSSIMMQLRLVDYIAFSGVCKSWRSLAHTEKNKFMSSKQPMSVSFSTKVSTKAKKECYLTDFDRNRFKTVLPRSTGRTSVGSTCGYLIFFGRKTREFCLVNPITRHELHFPGFPFYVSNDPTSVRGILVFSPSMSGWVLVISHRFSSVISFSLAGTQPSWDYLSFNFPVLDIHYFMGKLLPKQRDLFM
ncbi:putative F-box protein [Helianthus annuus]|nr:putative F-box protein [Helianthus annuus]